MCIITTLIIIMSQLFAYITLHIHIDTFNIAYTIYVAHRRDNYILYISSDQS